LLHSDAYGDHIGLMNLKPPAPSEYNEFYAGYLARAEADPLGQLARQAEEVAALAALGDARAELSPKPGEWSAKQILGHLCDFERVFSYRALRFSRGDETPLSGFEQDPYVAAGRANERPLAELIEEFVALRTATLLLFRSFTEDMLDLGGVASGNPVTVRALVFITPGHCEGHLADIRRDYQAEP
jgi:hypothetical protein